MLSGKCGVALVLVNGSNNLPEEKDRVKTEYFAFNVSQNNFKKGSCRYNRLGLKYRTQNHQYFDAIYTNDLDG